MTSILNKPFLDNPAYAEFFRVCEAGKMAPDARLLMSNAIAAAGAATQQRLEQDAAFFYHDVHAARTADEKLQRSLEFFAAHAAWRVALLAKIPPLCARVVRDGCDEPSTTTAPDIATLEAAIATHVTWSETALFWLLRVVHAVRAH